MKLKKLLTFFCIGMGIAGLILLIFGLQSNGTLSPDIQKIGMAGIGVFAVWAIIKLIDGYMKKRELENM